MDQRGTSRNAQSPPSPAAPPGFALGSPAVLGRSMADIAERSQRLVADWLHRQSRDAPDLNPMNIAK